LDTKVIGGFVEIDPLSEVLGEPDPDFSLADSIYQSSTSGRGRGALFTVTEDSLTYTVTLVKGGFGYSVGDTVTISGEELGGAAITNDLTFTIASTIFEIYAVAKESTDKNNYTVNI
jgi:hypothetical protein